MVQGAPLHNIRALEALKDLTEKGRGGVSVSQDGEKGKGKATGREDRLKAARAIMDWWVGGGAPNRKLRYFRDQPLLHPDVTDQHLVIWYFEDWLKKYFFSYLQILEAFSLDPLPYVRMQSLALITALLRSHPEQEQNLLRLLVNKLGDTESSICARTSYYLLHILQEHPAMKAVIIQETTALIMRPTPPMAPFAVSHSQTNRHIPSSKDPKSAPQREKNVWRAHAQYYAAITFNQIVLSTSATDRAAARKLMDVYFQLFREVVGEREPELADDDATSTKEKLKDKGKEPILKKKGARKGKGKEVRGAAGFAEVQDANAKLLGAILTGISRALPYAKFGGGDVEFDKHMDTLFLLVHTSTFNISLRALTLIQQIAASSSASSPLVPRFYRALYATLLDPRLHTARNQALFLNLLFKSLKADPDQARVMAFVKRFCQVLVSGLGGSEFVAGGLWLLGELLDTSPGLRTLIDRAPSHDTEVEVVEDYDPYKREPQYAHAQSSALWELTTLVNHTHPTIALLARQLLNHEPLTSSPDLTLYTLTHFLDRFVYKNPKKAGSRGTSAMQPSTTGGGGVSRVRADVQETPLNVGGWWRRGESGVAPDQVFFQRYFAQEHGKEQVMAAKVDRRKANHHNSDTKSDGTVEGGSDEDSDPEEAAIWKAMKVSMPKAEEDDADEDVDDNDIDDEDDIPVDHSIQDSESDDHASSDTNTEEDKRVSSDAEDGIKINWEFDGIEFSDVDGSAGSDTQLLTALSGSKTRKRKGRGDEDERSRKKKLRALPTFASYEDYARMIEDGPEENI